MKWNGDYRKEPCTNEAKNFLPSPFPFHRPFHRPIDLLADHRPVLTLHWPLFADH